LLTDGLCLQWHIISEIVYLFTYLLTYFINPWSRALLERVSGFQVFSKLRIFSHFMEPEVSLPHSQVPAVCPYPEPPRSSPFGIIYCLYLQQYLNMCSNIVLSTVQLVCSNAFLSKVNNIKAHAVTHSKQSLFLPLVIRVCAIVLAKYPYLFFFVQKERSRYSLVTARSRLRDGDKRIMFDSRQG